MAEFRTDGGGVLCEDLVRKVFEYDGHAEEARAACVAKGWGDVRRGPPWMIETGPAIKRSELDVYGLEPFGPEQHSEAAFSRDASIMVILSRGAYQEAWPRECKKLALYDVATGKLRLMKRPPGRG